MVVTSIVSAILSTEKVILPALVSRPGWKTLSLREREVLHWLSLGKSAEDVATILDLSISTIMFHCRGAARKYGTVNRTHTVAEAFRRGDLPIEPISRAASGGEMYEI